ncbi:hypothetical protein [Rhizobium sp. Leaf386]|uniref:hypothetical protein n=1 Tax=Rhizobium sp. Leaf386 TaxID=1736359 RepID=UPI0007154AAF|nr:hypothetical protein [Rhizobium sp. Leaf386]KQS95398.1 hypothetical protein ASG50_25580 [Rhizobium sp. Leaf386]
MTIPAYPSELPPPLRNDYSEQFGDGRSFFRNDAGPSVPGQLFAAVMDPISYSTRINRWQLGLFDSFFLDTLKRGIVPFTMPASLTDGYTILDENAVELLDENDEPLIYSETMLVRFADDGLPARTSVQADAFRVSFRLVVLPT